METTLADLVIQQRLQHGGSRASSSVHLSVIGPHHIETVNTPFSWGGKEGGGNGGGLWENRHPTVKLGKEKCVRGEDILKLKSHATESPHQYTS